MKNALFIVPVAIVSFLALTGFRGAPSTAKEDFAAKQAKFTRIATAKVDNALDDLKATPDQRVKVQALKDGLLKEGAVVVQGNQATRAELTALWSSEKPDARVVHAIVDARFEAVRGLLNQAVDAVLELHAILSPAQRAQVSEKAEAMHRY